MRLLATRTLFVLAALTVPQFIKGVNTILFAPAVNLWRWGDEAVRGLGGGFSIQNPDFLWNVLLLFAVPLAMASWFALTDMLRQDSKGVKPRSRYLLGFFISLASWLLLVVAISYSVTHSGPLYFNYSLFADYWQAVYGTALVLVIIDFLTHTLYFNKG